MKPGNSVEEKTLTTGTRREGRALWHQAVHVHLGKTRTAGARQPAVGSHGREAESDPDREPTQRMDSGASNQEGAASCA